LAGGARRRAECALARFGTGLLVGVVLRHFAAVVVFAARVARAARLCWARVIREPSTLRIAEMAIIGSAAIGLVWFFGGLAWQGLLTAAGGMAASGGLVWAVRVVATVALRRRGDGIAAT